MSNTILAVDTATENCSVALKVADKIYHLSEVSPRGHTDKILPMVDNVLKQANITLQDVDYIAYGQGPGSFTGVRIGIGIAQGLAFGINAPMVGISTLQTMAHEVFRTTGHKQIACAIDARMSEIYWARYQHNGEQLEIVDAEQVIAPELLIQQVPSDEHTWLQAGTGWSAYSETLATLSIETSSSDISLPKAYDMVLLAEQKIKQGDTVAVENAEPVYLRDKVTWKKLLGR